MVNLIVTYRFAAEQDIIGFLKEIEESGAAEKTRYEHGCNKYEYFIPALKKENAGYELLLWEQWEDMQSQKEHTHSPHFEDILRIKSKYKAETEIIRV